MSVSGFLRSDHCAFWKFVRRFKNPKCREVFPTVGGFVGEQNIANAFRDRFSQLYNRAATTDSNDFSAFIGNGCILVTVSDEDVLKAVQYMKCGKADGLYSHRFFFQPLIINLVLKPSTQLFSAAGFSEVVSYLLRRL